MAYKISYGFKKISRDVYFPKAFNGKLFVNLQEATQEELEFIYKNMSGQNFIEEVEEKKSKKK